MYKTIFKTILLFVALSFATNVYSQIIIEEFDDYHTPNVLSRGTLDANDTDDVMGFFKFGNYFWVSYWNLYLPGNQFGKLILYREEGNSMTKFNSIILNTDAVPAQALNESYQNFLNFTTDGKYVYGVNMSRFIFVIDPAEYKIVDVIELEDNAGFISIAYDYEKDGFWCSDQVGNRIWFVKRDGSITPYSETILAIDQEYDILTITGLAYDDFSEGGPYLWYSISGTQFDFNVARIGRYNIRTGENDEAYYNAKDAAGFYPVGGVFNGGMYSYIDHNKKKFVVAGIVNTLLQLYALDMGDITEAATPRMVENLNLLSSKETGMKIDLSWTNPKKTVDRTEMTTISSIAIYRDNTLVHSINSALPGEEMTWSDTGVSSEGLYTYSIVVSNSAGLGMKAEQDIYAGEDTPGAPLNAKLQKIDSSTASVSWKVPARGNRNGWFDESSLKYKLVRMPDNVVVAENITATSYLDKSIQNLGTYYYTITSYSNIGEGGTASTNKYRFGDAMTVPWYESFENEDTKEYWTTFDLNEDYTKFESSFGRMILVSVFDEDSNDDWAISPAIHLEAGKEYRLRYDLEVVTKNVHNNLLTVNIGKTATVEDQTITIKEYDRAVDPMAQQDVIFTVEESGDYYFGWHVITFGEAKIVLDEVSIVESPNIDMSLSNFAVPEEMNMGEEYTLTLTVKNEGKTDVNNFKLNLWYSTEEGQQTSVTGFPKVYTSSVASGSKETISVTFIPTEYKAHTFQASVELASDEIADNNISASFNVPIFPKGSVRKYIGDPETAFASQLAPFNFYYMNGAAEALYTQQQLGKEGVINFLEYYYYFNIDSPVKNRPVKIYMAHTKWEDMTEGWCTTDTICVYDGILDFEVAKHSRISIPLQKPFLYNGKDNLVVFTCNTNEVSSNPMNQFDMTYTEEFNLRVQANTLEDFDFDQVGRIIQQIPNTSFMISNLGAKLSGKVTDDKGNALEGLRIGFENSSWSTVTNEEGVYEFPFLPEGDYSLNLLSAGYALSSTVNVKIENKKDKVVDIQLNGEAKVVVSGKVKGLEKVNVLLSGLTDYQVLTDNNGNFRIDNVFSGDYTLTFYKEGYVYQSKDLNVETDDINLAEVVLTACESNAPIRYNIKHYDHDWNSIYITWGQPDGINVDKYVIAYNLYVNDILVKVIPASSRKLIYSLSDVGNYKCQLSAIWNDKCESNRESLSIIIEEDPWNTVVASFPWKEDFETGVRELYWKEQFINASQTHWEVVQNWDSPYGYVPVYEGRYGIMFSETSRANNITRLITPQLDLTSLEKPSLEFFRYTGEGAVYYRWDELFIWYKNAPDAAWQLLTYYSEATNDWVKSNLKLPNPTDTYWIAFEGNTFFGNGVMLDNIKVYDAADYDSIEDVSNGSSVSVYPSRIETSVTIKGDNLKSLRIYNMVGSIVDTRALDISFNTINVENLSSGAYLFQIITNTGETITKKVMKQ